MTVKNITERVQQVFPNIGRTQIIKDVNSVQKKYAGETSLLKKEGQLTDITSNITWSLPSDCKQVIDIVFYNSNDMPLYMEDLGLAYEIVFGKLTFINNDGTTKLTKLPTTVSTAYIDYEYFPVTITAETGSLTVDEELHEGILAGVFELYFSTHPVDVITRDGVVKARDWQASRYWSGKYKDWVTTGKARAMSNQDNINSKVKVDKLGNPVVFRRQKLSTTTSINVSGLSAIYSKYIRFTVTSPSTIAINEQFGWTTGIDTPTISNNVITMASNSELTNTMLWNINQTIRHERVDADSWTFDVYDNWGTLVVEIFER